MELSCGIVEIELIEHAMLPVLGQCRPVLTTQRPALSKQSGQVGFRCQHVAIYTVVNMVAAHLIVFIANRHHVNTFAWLQRQRPVVLWHTRYDIVVRQCPIGSHVAVLYPNIVVLLRKAETNIGILYEDAGMWFAVVVHDVALVVDDILNGQRRRNHLPRRAEMVELTARQRYDGYCQLVQFFVFNEGVSAQRTTELSVEVVLLEGEPSGRTAGNSRALHEQLYCLVTQQPDADVRQVVMVFLQCCQLLYAWLLQHLLQHIGSSAVADEDTVVLGDGCVEPQTIANDISLRNLSQSLCSTDIHVAAHYHRRQTLRSLLHDALIEWQLQVEECL